VSITVLGPNDEPFIHDGLESFCFCCLSTSTYFVDNAGNDDDDEEGLSGVLMPPTVEQKGRLMKLQVYKAENLPVMDEALVGQGGADPYIKVDFAGSTSRLAV